MKILILGGTGAMGVALGHILAKRGDEVYITSRNNHKNEGNIHYLQGNAHDEDFLGLILREGYDVIVDFMCYWSSEFSRRVDTLIGATNQYIFTSSGRVFADSEIPITESSPRLLDVCKDKEYLKTDEYALAKARSENILLENKQQNWTIIRPYITYNVERLQLGTLEKDVWLYRALHGRSLILPEDVASHQVTMTYGDDVAKAIAMLIGNKKTLGEVYNITGSEHMAWSQVQEIYLDILEKRTGIRPNTYMPESSAGLIEIMGNKAQVYYDRLFTRVFDNSKLCSVIGEDFKFTPMKRGLSNCLNKFMDNPIWLAKASNKFEAYVNKRSGDKMQHEEFYSYIEKVKYFGWYNMPGIMSTLRKLKK